MNLRYLSLLLGVFLLSGCFSTLTPTKPPTGNQQTIDNQEKKIDKTLDLIDKNEKGKKIQTSTLAQGIQYSLTQVTNPPVQVETAKSLNERVG